MEEVSSGRLMLEAQGKYGVARALEGQSARVVPELPAPLVA
jgi:hypothetical protein